MRCSRRTTLDLVDVHDIQTVIGTRIVFWAMHRPHRRPQRETADPAHAIDANTH
jgi:DNA-binding cell septation regulator SpoVG